MIGKSFFFRCRHIALHGLHPGAGREVEESGEATVARDLLEGLNALFVTRNMHDDGGGIVQNSDPSLLLIFYY